MTSNDSAELAQTLFEEMGDAAFIVDPRANHVLRANPVAQRLTGLTPAELLNLPLERLLRPEKVDDLKDLLQALHATRTFHSREDYLLRGRHDTWTPVSLTLARFQTERSPLGLVLARDDSERKRAEEQLRGEHTLLRTLIDSCPDIIFTKDTRGRFRLCNQALLRFTGATSEADLAGKTVFELFPGEHATGYDEDDRRVLTRGETIFNREELARDAAGQDSWRSVIKAPLRDSAGRITGLVGISRNIQQWKERERALAESEGRLRLAQQVARLGAFEWDLRTNVNSWTPELEALYGLRPGEFGKTQLAWEQLVHPDDRVETVRCVEKAFGTTSPVEAEWRVVWPDGSCHWIAGRFQVDRDDEGNPVRLTGVNLDITARKLADQERQKFVALAESSHEFIGMCDRDFIPFFVNPAGMKLVGLPDLGAACRVKVQDYFFPEDQDFITDVFFPRVLREGHGEVEIRFRHFVTGEAVWMLYNVFGIKDASGETTGWATVSRDIHDRKLAEQALRETRQRLSLILEGANVGVWDWDLTTNVVSFSREWKQQLGYREEEIPGHFEEWRSRVHPDDLPQALELVARSIARCSDDYSTEFRMRHKDGSWRWILANGFVLAGPDGRPARMLGVHLDLTAQKRAEEGRQRLEAQFLQSQKMEAIGQLAGGVAHDFNNLLTVINGYAEFLLDSLPPSDPTRDLLSQIHKAGQRAGSLTRQLLAFSRQQVLDPKVLNLNGVVSDTDKMLRRLIGEDVILTTDLDAALKPVKADPGQLEQILVNLAVNARDAMPQGGRLTVRTRNVNLDEAFCREHGQIRPGGYVLLAVTDTGCGMDEATKARIFEPFFTTKGVGKGTGLGLATVHGIVNQSEGQITVTSAVGAGTTFEVYLPQVRQAPAVGKSPPDSSRMPRGTETVMLVEDEETVRALGRHVLRTCGYTVLEAGDGKEALELLGHHEGPIDLLMSDVVMPHLGGRELAERVVRLRPRCKVLFLSGYTDDAVIRHGVLESEVAFLQKPFTPSQLAQKAREVLDGSG